MAAPEGKAISRWPKLKSAAKAGLAATGVGISGAQTGLNISTVALATGAAAASATGIGLVVTGGIATLTGAALSGKSALSTSKIVDTLENIAERRGAFGCFPCPGQADSGGHAHHRAHAAVRDDVLPYVLAQKEEKLKRKIFGAVPVVNSAGTVYSASRWMYKKLRGSLGEDRNRMASVLAEHLITRDCPLAQAIVSALFSYEEMLWLLEKDESEVAPLLAKKMKSV
jgi:hypothetical protein